MKRLEIKFRPHLLVTARPTPGLRDLDTLRRDIRRGVPKMLWERLLTAAEADLAREPFLPGSPYPGRPESQVRLANSDAGIVNAAGDRMKRDAVAWLVTGEKRFAADALRQMEALFDEQCWPDWLDRAHREKGLVADLRTGQLLRAFGYAYDWLHEALSAGQRRWLVENLDRRAVGPYLHEVARDAWFTGTGKMNNWNTCVVGGAATAAMALGEAHPASAAVLGHARRLMRAYLAVFGPGGEFNESVAYSGSVSFPAEFYTALRYHLGGGENPIGSPPFTDFCRWYMYFVCPPGRPVPFGDSGLDARPRVSLFPAVAAASRDGLLQWFYRQHVERAAGGDAAIELLTFDPSLAPVEPDGRLPRGRAWRAHGANWSSRSDWNPCSTACVVYGKGGHGREGHGNHDAGQVCIEAYGKRLITDPGSPTPAYPGDFFGPERWRYYNAHACGHNVLTFGGRGMRPGEEYRAEIIDARFADGRGGRWMAELGALYDGAVSVRRSVIHLAPAVVAVLDEACLEKTEEISLRWHTADRCAPGADGSFRVENAGVRLAGRLLRLDAEAVSFGRGEHRYHAPFDRDRYDRPLEQKRESYIEARCCDRRCRFLSLFAVFGPGQATASWSAEGRLPGIETPGGRVAVDIGGREIRIRNENSGVEWSVPFQR